MRSVFVLLSWTHDRSAVSVLLPLGREAGALCVAIVVTLRGGKDDIAEYEFDVVDSDNKSTESDINVVHGWI